MDRLLGGGTDAERVDVDGAAYRACGAAGKILYTREELENRARELGKQISEDYAGEELILLGTLKGAVMWMADLMKQITLDTEIDFISASSYGSGTVSSGSVKIKKDIDIDIRDDLHGVIFTVLECGGSGKQRIEPGSGKFESFWIVVTMMRLSGSDS